ncbi:MAG: hypothetical protein DRN15_01480 [Thermoprotei archaeon]|nr:MAG: hypothetical protein DRN15_01480 [Thermoprotei archaeon]RLF25865.1 MAG: hypothetical protein DRM97_00375 [Thermoprotei archaeon]
MIPSLKLKLLDSIRKDLLKELEVLSSLVDMVKEVDKKEESLEGVKIVIGGDRDEIKLLIDERMNEVMRLAAAIKELNDLLLEKGPPLFALRIDRRNFEIILGILIHKLPVILDPILFTLSTTSPPSEKVAMLNKPIPQKEKTPEDKEVRDNNSTNEKFRENFHERAQNLLSLTSLMREVLRGPVPKDRARKVLGSLYEELLRKGALVEENELVRVVNRVIFLRCCSKTMKEGGTHSKSKKAENE